MLELFLEAHQYRRIADAESSASSAAARAGKVEADIHFLQRTVDKLILVNTALWSLLQEKTGLTDQQLLDRLEQIDLRDGHADGRIPPAPANCPQCRRTLHPRHKHCIYCGQKRPIQTAFDGL